MSARFKVGDRVTLTGTVVEVDATDKNRPAKVCLDGQLDGEWMWPHREILERARPATRAPWDVLREAAALLDGRDWQIVRDHLASEADRLEAAARPPSLLEAAKLALLHLPLKETEVVRGLSAAIAAAEKENSQ